MNIAIIGSREPSASQVSIMRDVITTILELNGEHQIITGGATGIDNLALSICKTRGEMKRLHLYLPWRKFVKYHDSTGANITVFNPEEHQQWIDLTNEYHPAPQFLTRTTRPLHARNAGIILHADVVIAAPSTKQGGGGTGQGIRLAEGLNKPYFVLQPEMPRESDLVDRILKVVGII